MVFPSAKRTFRRWFSQQLPPAARLQHLGRLPGTTRLHSESLRSDPSDQRLAMLMAGTLWLFNIAMENGPSIDGLPIKNGDFPWLC